MSDFNLIKLCENAKKASKDIAKLTTNEKNKILNEVAKALITNAEDIINANSTDMENGKANNMPESLLDRLLLDKSRIEGMAEGLYKVALLEDPVGEVTDMTKRPNGMVIGKKRVPMGVIGIIYEARPNVTSDAFALCFKTSNIVILKGGSDSINSNIAIVKVIRKVLSDNGYNPDFVQLIESTDRETTKEFMKMNKYVDLLIPRGSAGLIAATLKNSTIPVIETGTGNCHIFVDESADIKMATDILINAKTQRIGVCNACESLVVHKNIADTFLPQAVAALKEKNVEVRGDERVLAICNDVIPATEEDFYTEYLDYIISIKIVDSIDEAIAHINEHNTRHSETIVTKDYDNSNKFLDEIDAACVYVNASTRFTDGFEFGFGAEIGISTQKLHARGPMGLRELCTSKYIIYGNGQIR
ncbi:MAG: glutamate-5-semialdehyde dehydrogenase [Lachnospiraceae bacterium]|nr:glutamate-5-semialdehyde dehydrogenase [Lachnospiraceae bacterium]